MSIANSFISNVNKIAKNLDRIFSSIAEIAGIKVSVDEAVNKANEAVNKATLAATKAENILVQNQELIAKEATETNLGAVRYASDKDVTDKNTNKVVRASQLGKTIDNLNDRTKPATTGSVGLVRLATVSEVTNGSSGSVVTPDLLKYYQFKLDTNGFYVSGKNSKDIPFIKTSVTSDSTILDMYGKIVITDDLPFRVEFPNPILTSEVGIGAVVVNDIGMTLEGVTVAITATTRDYIDLAIIDASKQKASGTILFNLKASLDITVLPPVPKNVTSTANGKTVTLSWDV